MLGQSGPPLTPCGHRHAGRTLCVDGGGDGSDAATSPGTRSNRSPRSCGDGRGQSSQSYRRTPCEAQKSNAASKLSEYISIVEATWLVVFVAAAPGNKCMDCDSSSFSPRPWEQLCLQLADVTGCAGQRAELGPCFLSALIGCFPKGIASPL